MLVCAKIPYLNIFRLFIQTFRLKNTINEDGSAFVVFQHAAEVRLFQNVFPTCLGKQWTNVLAHDWVAALFC